MKKKRATKATTPPAIEALSITALRSDPRQIRRHTDRNLTMIGDGLKAVGAARSIVVDEDNTILAGNGTIDAAQQAGFTKVRVIDADGSEIIAVRRRGLTDKQKVELALYDNRSSDFAEYDPAALTRIADLVGVDPDLFFTAAEHQALLGSAAAADDAVHVSLVERFGVPPFSVLDARQGYWQARKDAWLALGIESDLGRGEAMSIAIGADGQPSKGFGSKRGLKARRRANATPGGAAMPAANYSKSKARGDGKGRPMTKRAPNAIPGGAKLPLDRAQTFRRRPGSS